MRKYFSYVLIHPRWIRQNRRQNTRRPHNCTEGTLLVIAQSTASNVATCINNFFPTLKTLNLAHFAHLLSITHHIDQKYFFKNEKTFNYFSEFLYYYIYFFSLQLLSLDCALSLLLHIHVPLFSPPKQQHRK